MGTTPSQRRFFYLNFPLFVCKNLYIWLLVSGTSYSSWRDILSPTPVLEGKEQENAPKARSLLEVIRFPVLDPLQVANHVAPYRLLRSSNFFSS